MHRLSIAFSCSGSGRRVNGIVLAEGDPEILPGKMDTTFHRVRALQPGVR
ncbi:MAG: hypothetical protein ACLFVX_07780 [Archaeoglobaceae archaeon]